MSEGATDFTPRGTVIALTSDLAAASLIRTAAEHAGAVCVMALDAASALRRLDEIDTSALMVINLETRGLDIAAFTTALAERPEKPPVIAFAPHVHERMLQAAKEAACEEVVSRGKFHASAEELISRHLPN